MADERPVTTEGEQQEVVCGTCKIARLFMCHDPEPLPDGKCGRCGIAVSAHHTFIPAPVVSSLLNHIVLSDGPTTSEREMREAMAAPESAIREDMRRVRGMSATGDGVNTLMAMTRAAEDELRTAITRIEESLGGRKDG